MPIQHGVTIAAVFSVALLGGCSTTKNVMTEETFAYLTTDGQVVGGKTSWGPPGTRTLSETELQKGKAKP